MSDQIGNGQPTVEDVLARQVEARRGGSSPWAGALREMGAIDRAVYQAVADTPSPELDGASDGSRLLRITRGCGSGSLQRWPCSVAVVVAARHLTACSDRRDVRDGQPRDQAPCSPATARSG